MMLSVLAVHPNGIDNHCEDAAGKRFYVDLLIGGDFPADVTPQLLVGRRVEVNSLEAYIFIGHGVGLVDEVVV